MWIAVFYRKPRYDDNNTLSAPCVCCSIVALVPTTMNSCSRNSLRDRTVLRIECSRYSRPCLKKARNDAECYVCSLQKAEEQEDEEEEEEETDEDGKAIEKEKSPPEVLTVKCSAISTNNKTYLLPLNLQRSVNKFTSQTSLLATMQHLCTFS